MVKYAVIGYPVGHSRSPGMQNAAFFACGINAEYLKLEVAPEELGEFVGYARRSLAGFNLTVPHKQAIIPFLDEIDPAAKRIGSVNTVRVLPGGRLSGCSTDGEGFEEAVRFKLGIEIAGGSFLLLGCGGAARAVAFRLAERGARSIRIANRHVEKAAALAREIGGGAAALELSDVPALYAALRDSGLLIQATSLGLHADDAPPMPPELLESVPGIAVTDLIYLPTALLLRARALGLRCCDGREMLLRQGAASFRFWTGVEPPLDAMRRGMENERTDRPPFDWKRN